MDPQPYSNEKLRSESLNLLRFPLAVVVVMIHTFSSAGLKLQGQQLSFDAFAVFQEINHFIDGFLRGQSVPIYYFISGYVFFLGVTLNRETYRRKLHNRMKTLLIPYLIWNTLTLLQILLYRTPPFRSFFPGLASAELNLTLSGVLNCLWDRTHSIFLLPESTHSASFYPMNYPLWFIRDLMIVVLCAPLLYYLLRRMRHYFVCLIGLLWFLKDYVPALAVYGQLLTALFFFSWGAYMSISRKDMLVEFGRYFRPSVVLYVLLGLLHVASAHWLPEASTTIKQLNVLVGLIFAYNLASWLLRRGICRPNAFLASASFFIYVAHSLVLNNTLKSLFVVIAPASELTLIGTYLLALVLTVGGLLLAFWLLRKYAPGLLRVMTGKK